MDVQTEYESIYHASEATKKYPQRLDVEGEAYK